MLPIFAIASSLALRPKHLPIQFDVVSSGMKLNSRANLVLTSRINGVLLHLLHISSQSGP